IVADTIVAAGGSRERVRLVMVHGQQGITPSAVWLDERGDLFASAVAWFITVRPGAEGTLPALRAIELSHRDAQGAEMARRITPAASGTVVIRNGDVFDSERGVMVPRTTVVIEGDRIVAVGPAALVATPRGARVIDATGKSVVPGLWDMHTHFQATGQTGNVVRQLAGGITTIRDLAADIDVAVSHRDRANAGALVAPRVLLGGFIEGPGLWAGPSDVLVRTEDEARAWVARYDSLGYRQIKLYNIVHPDLVPVIAEETRKRGMRLSGHVPRGLSVPAAVRLGFDEINHAAFLFSTFFQDSLYVPEMRPYSGVAGIVAPNVNVDGPEMTALIADLAAHGTVVDGTFNLWLRDTTGANAERARAGNANYLRLIKRLHDGGVTLVPGTDGSSYNQELENYERAGITASEVLRLATIVSARVMKDDADYGSIAPGKIADLVIVNGRPAERIADLRQVDMVFRAGKGYEPAVLMEAIGMRRAAPRADR
ncbi:MAG TPA: amidohydrolase family protein, partial [Gemmatimonadaceae bacterium]|nr:amidohydrolase family protein [Gemmatimonadaceae bacterium]